jgi:hypothetical protein
MNTLTTQEQQRIKDHFEVRVNRRSRKEMITFLTNHFRYYTINSCNQTTSYAHCIKLHHGNLGLPSDIGDVMYDMIYNPEWCDHMSDLINQFSQARNHTWQVGINGRSSGYLVLYQGCAKNKSIICYPGRSTDQDKNFHEWDMDELRMRVGLICDFDMLASDIAMDFTVFCRTYYIAEETVMVPKKVQVLREKS